MNTGEERMPAQQPNIIWLFSDQHRAQATGYAGDPNVATPNLDRMAAEGIVFTGAVAGFPLCCPFRGSLLTSRYPHECIPCHEYPMPHDQSTVAHAFKAGGYRTSYFGKWHVDGFNETIENRGAMHIVPPERRGGFDEWLGYENNNAQWDSWVHGGEGESAVHYRLPGYETDALTDIFVKHLTEQSQEPDKPFFSVLSVQPPHNPYVAPAEWMAQHTPAGVELRPNVPHVPRVENKARRGLAGYYAQIENLDWNIGRIRTALAETGLAENTYIIYMSDHGNLLGSQGQFQKTAPWAESINIPFIVTGPSVYGYHRGENDVPLNHVDIAPTSLGLAGIDTPEWMSGSDYSGLYRMDRPAPVEADSAYLQMCMSVPHPNSIDRPWRGIVTRDGWKYACLEHQPWMLYNLNEDPYEQSNLAYDMGFNEHRRRLHERLRQWIADTGDSFPLPKIP
jgi:arylsulfatase A-like enzyme